VSGNQIDVISYPRGTALDRALDPITTRVIAGALESIVLEVGHKLSRMAYSSVIRESEDFGAAILDAQGRQVCECPLSTPLQLGPIPGYVRGIEQIMAERGQAWHEGDVIMHNSSFHGASHQPDVAFCVPVFHEGELVGYSVTTAHHLDLGALVPGSVGIVDATDAYAEGLQFRAVKVYERGEANRGIWQLLRDNIRSADMVVGDMEAQIAAARVGARRYVELLEEYGRATVEDACEELMNYSERVLRDTIAELPDGVYRATGYVDGFPDDPDPERGLLPVKVAVTIEGDTLTVDLTGTAPQVAEKAINMPFVGTVDIAVYVTLRSILLDQATHEDMPQNSGLVRPIRIVAERGSMANPAFPAATIARFCPGNVVADTLMTPCPPSAATASRRAWATSRSSRTAGCAARTTGSTWTSVRAPTAGCWSATASTPWTRSTPTPATTPSRTSRPTTRCGCAATSCAPITAARAGGAAGWARCARSSSSPPG